MNSTRLWRLFLGLCIAIVVLLACIGGLVYASLPAWESRGQFGDMFGLANALFSGLAFAGVIVAILLQREELQQQRQELVLQREEMARAVEAQRASEAALRYRNDLEEALTRRRLSLDLINEWQSDQLRRSRRQALRLVRRDASDYSIPSLAEMEAGREVESFEGAIHVIYFFEKWMRLVEQGAVDPTLLWRLFGREADYLREAVIAHMPAPGHTEDGRLVKELADFLSVRGMADG